MAQPRQPVVPPSDAIERSAALWSEQLEKLHQALDPFGIAASFRKAGEGWLANPPPLKAKLVTKSKPDLEEENVVTR